MKFKMKIEVRNEDWLPGRFPGGRYLGKSRVLEKLVVKVQGGLGEVQNED